MTKRFQSKRGRLNQQGRLLLTTLALIFLTIVGIELYRWIVPFEARNPLYQEVTVGQKVIGNWRYLGEDPEGYLRFSNGSDITVYPPNSSMLTFDGDFIYLEQHSPGAMTYAYPLEAVPPKWFLIMAVVICVAGGYVTWKIRRRPRGMQVRRRKFYPKYAEGMQSVREQFTIPRRSARFRPKGVHKRK